jgi:2-oxoisovalerate dehydrogenase E2 component (dihydrolipoyl transacylase)
MAHEFRLPDIGEGLTDAEIVDWIVAVGDSVAVDQPIVEIETAKTTVEITATHAGTVTAVGGAPGDTINVGDILFVVGEPSVPLARGTPEEPSDDAGGSPTPPRPPSLEDSLVPPIGRPVFEVPLSRGTPEERSDDAGGSERPKAMPIVRKLASQRGIDVATVRGTGPEGSVTREDLDKAGGSAVTPLSRTRRTIARHMTQSWTTIPHVTVQADIRAEALLEARKARDFRPLPIEALVGMAVVPLLQQFPEFNATMTDDGVILHDQIDLGFAVDTPAGLMVAVVREAHSMSTDDLAIGFEQVSDAALTGTITPDEATGQTFTISNIGALGGGHGTPIIPVGTTAILSIGRATEQAVAVDGMVEVGLVAPIDLSYDHRLIDGGLGQRFLSSLIDRLEDLQAQ